MIVTRAFVRTACLATTIALPLAGCRHTAGFMPFYPGPGLGGHCIPLDPFYLAWAAGRGS